MREPILKAVSMPPKIFWAPFVPAIINASIQMGIMVMCIAMGGINPLWFIPPIAIGHFAIAAYAWNEPHMSKMMMTYGPMSSPTKNMYPSKGRKYAP